jgi:hypothetical protein
MSTADWKPGDSCQCQRHPYTPCPLPGGWVVQHGRERYVFQRGGSSFWVWSDATLELRYPARGVLAVEVAKRDRIVARQLLDKQPGSGRARIEQHGRDCRRRRSTLAQEQRAAEAKAGDPAAAAAVLVARVERDPTLEIDYLTEIPTGVGSAWADAFAAEVERLAAREVAP